MRFFRILTILFAAAGLLVLSAFVLLRAYLTQDQLKRLIVTAFERQLNGTLEIESLQLNPFKGFSINNLDFVPANEDSFPRFRVEAAHCSYSWKALLRRRLEINAIVVEGLELFLSPSLLPIRASSSDQKDSSQTDWLLGGQINRVEFRNTSIHMSSSSQPPEFSVEIPELSLVLVNLSLDSLFSDPGSPGREVKLDFRIGQSLVKFTRTWLEGQVFSAELPISADVSIQPDELGEEAGRELKMNLAVSMSKGVAMFRAEQSMARFNTFPLPPLSFLARGWLSSRLERADINWRLNGEHWLTGSGNLLFGNDPALELVAEVDTLHVHLWNLFSLLSPRESAYSQLVGIDSLAGEMSLRDGTLALASGRPFSLESAFSLDNFSLTDFKEKLYVRGLNGNGRLVYSKPDSFQINLSAVCQAVATLSDTGWQDRVNNAEISMFSRFEANGWPDSLHIRTKIDQFWGGTFLWETNWTQQTGEDQPFDFSNVQTATLITLSEIDLDQIGLTELGGQADLFLELTNRGERSGDLVLGGHTYNLSVVFDSTEGEEMVPDIDCSLTGAWSVEASSRIVSIQSARIQVNRLISGLVNAEFNFAQSTGEVYLENVSVDLPLLQDFFPGYVREELTTAYWAGEATLNTEFLFWQDSTEKLVGQIIGDLAIQNDVFENLYWYFACDSLELYGTYAGNLYSLEMDLDGQVGTMQLLDTTVPLHQGILTSSLSLENGETLTIRELSLIFPDENVKLTVDGSLDFASPKTRYLLSAETILAPDSISTLFPTTELSGRISGRHSFVSDPINPDILMWNGEIQISDLSLRSGTDFRLVGLNGSLRFSQPIDLLSWYFLPVPANSAEIRPFLFAATQPLSASSENNSFFGFRADSLVIGPYACADLRFAIDYKDGHILCPYFSTMLYDGNLFGKAFVNVNTGALSDVSYRISAQLARVNSAIFPGIRQKEKEVDRLALTLRLAGTGLDPLRKIGLDGEFRVTEINRDALGNLLKSLDPMSRDPGIRSALRLLGLGFEPTSLDFLIEHGNVYPKLRLKQPWFLPLRIERGEIAFSRIPLQWLINWFSGASPVGS